MDPTRSKDKPIPEQGEAILILRNPHLWLIVALTVLLGIIYYGELLNMSAWVPFGQRFFSAQYPHDLHRALLLLPMLYTAAIFHLRGAVVASLVGIALMVPYSVTVSPFPDAIPRAATFALVASLAAILLGSTQKRNLQIRQNETQIRRLNAELEQRVQQRTAELSETNEKLRLEIAQRKETEEGLAQHQRELGALYQALLAITQSLDLNEVLQKIVSQAGKALDSAYTSIVTVNPDGSLGIAREDFTDIPPLAVRIRPQGVTRRVIATGEPVVVSDVDADPGTNPVLVAAGVKSYAGVPIKAKGTTIGVLFVHSKQPNAFSDKLDLLSAFAWQAAIAIENARLYQEASTAGALREADRLKTELLSTVSHELRTPLAAIKGYSSLLISAWEKIPDEERRDFVHEIDQASDRLTELINNLLQLSRLEAGGLPLDKEHLILVPLLESAVKDMQRRARGHRLVTRLTSSLPIVEADPRRIRQVVDNLLDNAVKYSPEGTEITVRCQSQGQELAVSVQDQGVGISPQKLEQVFEPFYQVDSGLTRQVGGAGLGLSICKRLVEAHGGRIWAESTPGKGTTFIFTPPLKMEEPPAAPEKPASKH